MMNEDDDRSEGMSLSSSSAQGEDALAIADKVTAIDSTKERPKKKPIRGKGYTTTENLMASKAWIAASCDEINGSKQNVSDFHDAVGEKYKKIKEEQEACDANQRASNARLGMVAAPGKNPTIVQYPYGSGSSVVQHFQKKIAPDVVKWMGVIEITSDGEPQFKTGENYDKWIS
jgi:hypothetical protein